jgi:hypothetical protein
VTRTSSPGPWSIWLRRSAASQVLAGADVLALAERKITELAEPIESHCSLSTSLDVDP